MSLADVTGRIVRAARQWGRRPEDIVLCAVSKGQPVVAVEAVLAAGQRCFGENRVQEAEQKFAGLREHYPDLRLHLIGPLQTNKAKAAVELFDVIETVDRPELVAVLAAAVAKSGRRPDLYIQINTGAEPQKAGVAPADLPALLEVCRAAGLSISGLMCIPPVDQPVAPHFAFLDELACRHGLVVRSMGMSADFETAIQLGATEVRVGSALFGARA